MKKPTMPDPLKRYRLTNDDKLDLAAFDPGAEVFGTVGDEALKAAQAAVVDEIGALQSRLYAEGRRSLLIVLQGMDTSGKDGVTLATFRGTHPQGLIVTSFKAPSVDEAAHDFLWRVHAHAPAKGMIAVFNRSHYEAVIAERVLGLADGRECRRRYAQIVEFEQTLFEHGTHVVKCFLHLSPGEQKKRLQSRLVEEDKYWKFNPNDLVERKRWDSNRKAFTDAIRQTARRFAPWWIVPADRKAHRNLMVATVVRNTLVAMDPHYPPLDPKYREIVVD